MASYNIPSVIKGDNFNGVLFTISVNNVPIDLTGAIITMDLRLTKLGVSAKRFTSVGNAGITIVAPATDGKFTLNNQVIDITATKYFYDIQIVFADGTVKTYICGRWEIIQDVTYD
jgi:hypothetical protein